MFLRFIEIRNWRSLADVVLTDLGQFNVLIGRNNAGKSAVFNALKYLARLVNNHVMDIPDNGWLPLISGRDHSRQLSMRLRFQLRDIDRVKFVGSLQLPEAFDGRKQSLIDSPFARYVEFFFSAPPESPQYLHLTETRLLAEDGEWACCQKVVPHDDLRQDSPKSQVTHFRKLTSGEVPSVLSKAAIDVNSGSSSCDCAIGVRALHNPFRAKDPSLSWLQNRLARHLADSFFFEPFRHSARQPNSAEAARLVQDGSNLPQVLATILGSNRRQFERIESFVSSAVPDLGALQCPPRGAAIEAGYLSQRPGVQAEHFVHLHDMGGGIEQLVMLATVLFTTDDTNTLFLEEPETHLHPSSQRYILEKLVESDRQVFLTTHSPVFLNAGRVQNVYRVSSVGGWTQVKPVSASGELTEVLDDIGTRNSDVLLSDGVVFVEGPSDRSVLTAFAHTLGTPLAANNVIVLSMGGGEFAERGAPIRSDVLNGISDRAPVPHVFVLDRDERSDSEIEALRNKLGDKIHLFDRRELENYLLVPRAILAALHEKYVENNAIIDRLSGATESDIEHLISQAAEQLHGLVLIKRVRSAVPGLKGGQFSREIVSELIPNANDPNLADRIRNAIQSRLSSHLESIDFDGIVESQRSRLATDWQCPESRWRFAPGEELLSQVFREFGAEYNKTKDAVRIARQLRRDEIAEELNQLLERSASLGS